MSKSFKYEIDRYVICDGATVRNLIKGTLLNENVSHIMKIVKT